MEMSSELSVLVHWISTADRLPPLDHFVMVYRIGGKNNHNDVGVAYRTHRYGTRDDWNWVETAMNQSYWGISVDGSIITHWAEKPRPPHIEV